VLADVVDTDNGEEPSVQAIMVGALTAGDEALGESTRSDSPAARAHQLAQAIQQAEQEADLGAAASPPPVPEPIPGTQAEAGGSDSSEDLEEEDDDDPIRRSRGRRRWPVVTCVLMLLIGVVGVAGYLGWRLTQSQYYVGTDRGNVVVFQGVSQSVAGMSLSKVVQRTSIPLSALPSSEAGSIRLTIGPVSSLKQALRIISQFRQDYKCAVVQASIVEWVANRPKPAPPHHSKAKSGNTKSGRATADKTKTPARHRRAKHPTPRHTTTTHATPTPTPSPRPTPVKAARTSKSTGTTGHSSASPSPTSPSPTKKATSKTTQHRTGKTATHRKAKSANRRKTSKPHSVKRVKYPPEPVLPTFCPAFTGASG
jgi:protein phosphatase